LRGYELQAPCQKKLLLFLDASPVRKINDKCAFDYIKEILEKCDPDYELSKAQQIFNLFSKKRDNGLVCGVRRGFVSLVERCLECGAGPFLLTDKNKTVIDEAKQILKQKNNKTKGFKDSEIILNLLVKYAELEIQNQTEPDFVNCFFIEQCGFSQAQPTIESSGLNFNEIGWNDCNNLSDDQEMDFLPNEFCIDEFYEEGFDFETL